MECSVFSDVVDSLPLMKPRATSSRRHVMNWYIFMANDESMHGGTESVCVLITTADSVCSQHNSYVGVEDVRWWNEWQKSDMVDGLGWSSIFTVPDAARA